MINFSRLRFTVDCAPLQLEHSLTLCDLYLWFLVNRFYNLAILYSLCPLWHWQICRCCCNCSCKLFTTFFLIPLPYILIFLIGIYSPSGTQFYCPDSLGKSKEIGLFHTRRRKAKTEAKNRKSHRNKKP